MLFTRNNVSQIRVDLCEIKVALTLKIRKNFQLDVLKIRIDKIKYLKRTKTHGQNVVYLTFI